MLSRLMAIAIAFCSFASLPDVQMECHADTSPHVITTKVDWSNRTTRFGRDIIVKAGGELLIRNGVLQMMCRKDRQFSITVEAGGVFHAYDSTISGNPVLSKHTVLTVKGEGNIPGIILFENVELRYHYGITIERLGFLQATNITQGTSAGEISMRGGRARVIDSTHAVYVTLDSRIPTTEPINVSLPTETVGTPAAPWRLSDTLPRAYPTNDELELINSSVPIWGLFIDFMNPANPPMNLNFENSPKVAVGFLGVIGDSTAEGQPNLVQQLPCKRAGNTWSTQARYERWDEHPRWNKLSAEERGWTVGTVTAKSMDELISWDYFSFYLRGSSDLRILDSTMVVETFLSESSRFEMNGGDNQYPAWHTATTIDLRGNSQLKLTNCRIGNDLTDYTEGAIFFHTFGPDVDLEFCSFHKTNVHGKANGTFNETNSHFKTNRMTDLICN